MRKKEHNLPDWLPEQLRDDPKKLAVLGGLMIIFSFVMIRTFFHAGPSTASAANQPIAEPDPITQTLQANPLNTGYRPAEESSNNGPVQKWLNERLDLVSRDLFAVRLQNYPKLSDKAHGNGNSLVVGTWDENEKSESIEADHKKQRDAQIEALQTEASKLKLQSTIMGRDPMAILDGDVIKVGSVIKSGASDGEFKVVRIQSKSIVIERDGIRLELRMPE